MFGYNLEYALKDLSAMQYILADAVDYREAFDVLCDIYSVSTVERDEITEIFADESIVEICTVNDYYRMQRIKEYMKNCGGGYAVRDERVEELIAIKGTVIEQLQKLGLLTAYETSSSMAFDELLRKAVEGLVIAKRILGIMQMQGIFTTRDKNAALKNIRDAADWLNIPAILVYMYFNESSRAEYMDKLYTVTEKSDYTVLVDQFSIAFGIDTYGVSKNAKLLEKAFVAETAKRDVCSSQQLRVLRCNTLSEKDKRVALLSGNKELMSAVCALPLKLSCGKLQAETTLPPVLDRIGESKSIMRALGGSDLRNRDFFKPVCICSPSKYMRNSYADAVVACFPTANVVRIDVASLFPSDFDATENNVFVRSCREKGNNVYIIELADKIDERIVKLVKTFASVSGRRAFSIQRLSITIDLSSVLPIFICDKANAQLLSGAVATVEIAEIRDDERPILLKDLIAKKETQFGIGKITLDDGAIEILLHAPIDNIGDILSDAILARYDLEQYICLSAAEMRLHSQSKINNIGYGFGDHHVKK